MRRVEQVSARAAARRLWRSEPLCLVFLPLTLWLFWHTEPLTAAEAATRNADDPSSFVDKEVSVDFPEHGTHVGTVRSFDRETGYRVVFADNDSVDYGILELSRMLSQQQAP